jgi:hypothetical protein
VPQGDDAPGREVKTTISAMRARIPKEHTCAGARRELVWCGGRKVWIAQAAEKVNVRVRCRCTVKKLMGYEEVNGLARA